MMMAPLVALTTALAGVGVAMRARRLALSPRVAPLRRRPPRRLPDRVRTPLSSALDAAMVRGTPEDAVLVGLTAATLAGLVGVAVAPVVAPFLVVLVLVAAPLGLHLARGRHDAALVAALPGLVQRLAFELGAGASLEQALAVEADRDGPLAVDLRRVRGRVARGLPLPDALDRWVDARDLPEIRAVAGALGISVESGAPAAGALQGLARGLRDRNAAEAEGRTYSVQARLSAGVVGGAPLGFLVLSTLADPGSQIAAFGTRVGELCLAAGLVLEAAAVLWIRRIVAVPR